MARRRGAVAVVVGPVDQLAVAVVVANSRAFDPRATVALAPGQTPEQWWQVNEQAPIYTPADLTLIHI